MTAGLIILDRDGVINQDSDAFIKSPGEWQEIPGSAAALAALNRAGYTIAVATNQSGIGRGLLSRETLYRIHAKMRRTVARHGGRIDRIVYCPHLPGAGCDCRKPLPGMLLRLLDFYRAEPAATLAIGDSERDIRAAEAAGVRPLLVLTGNGERSATQLKLEGSSVFPDLAAATDAIVAGLASAERRSV